MKCPACDAQTEVIYKTGPRRRRQCRNGHRFTTNEAITSGVRPKAGEPQPVPPGGLLAQAWHSPLPSNNEKP
jgi:hypothetical protein